MAGMARCCGLMYCPALSALLTDCNYWCWILSSLWLAASWLPPAQRSSSSVSDTSSPRSRRAFLTLALCFFSLLDSFFLGPCRYESHSDCCEIHIRISTSTCKSSAIMQSCARHHTNSRQQASGGSHKQHCQDARQKAAPHSAESMLCCDPKLIYWWLLTLTLTVLPRASSVVSACFQSSLSASREALSTSPLSCTLPPATTHWVGQMASVNSAAGSGAGASAQGHSCVEWGRQRCVWQLL